MSGQEGKPIEPFKARVRISTDGTLGPDSSTANESFKNPSEKYDTADSDAYDRETVEMGRELERKYREEHKPDEFSKNIHYMLHEARIFYLAGERYRRKNEIIQRRKSILEGSDRRLDKARPSFQVLCLGCHRPMDMVEKMLKDDTKKERILFYFKCADCKQLRYFFDDEQEYQPDPPSCSKCQTSVDEKLRRDGNKLIWSYTCRKCRYRGKYILDLDEESNKAKDDKNFLRDRAKYCPTKLEGDKYVEDAIRTESYERSENLAKGNTLLDEEVKKIKILTVIQIEELLHPVFEKNGFIALTFEKPGIWRGSLTIDYSAQDYSMDEKPWTWERRNKFKRALKDALGNTNWRVMNEDVDYMLGLLKGRIRGVTGEDDLRELAQIRLKHDEKTS